MTLKIWTLDDEQFEPTDAAPVAMRPAIHAVVVASSEREARCRLMADQKASGEHGYEKWLDHERTTCFEVNGDVEAVIIVSHAGLTE